MYIHSDDFFNSMDFEIFIGIRILGVSCTSILCSFILLILFGVILLQMRGENLRQIEMMVE